ARMHAAPDGRGRGQPHHHRPWRHGSRRRRPEIDRAGDRHQRRGNPVQDVGQAGRVGGGLMNVAASVVDAPVFAERIEALRDAMRARGLDACVVLSSDPHLSEYLPEHWQARQWLSGFDGSAGTLVITTDYAGLWTDSRYWEQADSDLAGTGIQAMCAGAPAVPGPAQRLG